MRLGTVKLTLCSRRTGGSVPRLPPAIIIVPPLPVPLAVPAHIPLPVSVVTPVIPPIIVPPPIVLVAPPVPVVPPVITMVVSSFVPSRLSRGSGWRRRDILATRLGFVLPIALDTPVEKLNVRCGGSSVVRRRSRGGRRSFFRKSKTTLVRQRHLEMNVSILILALAT
jgi:hypothetical protein